MSSWIAIALRPGQPETRAGALAGALGIDHFTAVQWLRRPTPVMVPQPDPAAARIALARLTSAGVHAVLIDAAALGAAPRPQVVDRAVVLDQGCDRGPYRSVREGRLELASVGTVGVDRIALAVMGSLVKESTEWIKARPDGLSAAGEAIARFPPPKRRRQRMDRQVVDLYLRGEKAVRLLEGATTLDGLGTRRVEQAAAFARLRRWLGSQCRVDAGFAQEARFARRELMGDMMVLDTARLWDAWSARAYVLAQLLDEA
jgi:hypothetical protein